MRRADKAARCYQTKDLHPQAYALRPVRLDYKKDVFIHYEATTFPNAPRSGCDVYLRRVALFGLVEDGEGPLGIDVLDQEGSILQQLAKTREGFEYLRRRLKFRKCD